jgi:hypothetical protein
MLSVKMEGFYKVIIMSTRVLGYVPVPRSCSLYGIVQAKLVETRHIDHLVRYQR